MVSRVHAHIENRRQGSRGYDGNLLARTCDTAYGRSSKARLHVCGGDHVGFGHWRQRGRSSPGSRLSFWHLCPALSNRKNWSRSGRNTQQLRPLVVLRRLPDYATRNKVFRFDRPPSCYLLIWAAARSRTCVGSHRFGHSLTYWV